MNSQKNIVCSKMWTDINVRIPYKSIINCCKKDNTVVSLEEIQEKGIDVFHFRKEEHDDKKHFVENNWFPKNCRNCEQNWPNSIWNRWNKWREKTTDEVAEFPLLSLENNMTEYIEIMLSTVCNQTCMYCGSHTSSLWAELEGLKQTEDTEYLNLVLGNIYEFVDKKQIDNVTYNFLGGEPFLDLRFNSVLDNLVNIHKKNNTHIARLLITTNLNIKRKVLENFLSKWNSYNLDKTKLVICPSIDRIGRMGEIIRDGLNFNLFDSNIDLLCDYAKRNNNFRISWSPAINLLSISGHLELLRYIENKCSNMNSVHQWTIGENFINGPLPMHPGLAPESYKNYMDESIQLLKNHEHLKRHMHWCKYIKNMIGTKRQSSTLNGAAKWYKEKGKIKSINYFSVFPFLDEILNTNANE